MLRTRPRRETVMASLFAAALLLLAVMMPFASCHDHEARRRPVIRRARDVPTTGCYIVAMKDDASEAQMQQVLRKAVKASDDTKLYGMVQRVKKAFTVKLNPYALEMVRHLPGIDYIEEEGFAVGDQNDSILPWHVDRIDQASLPLDFNYSPIGDGNGVDVYILDSGINYDHEEFESRAKYGGYDPVDAYNGDDSSVPKQYGRDCHGHGTHVASLCGGKTYGSAKKVNVYSIRVLACNNAAPWSVVIDGLDYVSKVFPQRGRPVVLSMSLSGAYHRTVNDIVEKLTSEGITVVTVAGNGKADSCSRSPASANSAITVGASSSVDGLYSSTNYGLCVDVFAPGSRILAADHNCTNCSKYLSGTSMAAPIVSGIVAVHLSRKPRLTPSAVKQLLISETVDDVLVYDEEIIPVSSWDLTKNRLVQLTGSCGGNNFFLNSGTILSPSYPANYPPNLCCVWTITAEAAQFIVLDIWYLHLENKYDTLKVYDGPCNNELNLVEEFTGFRGESTYTYTTESNVLCLKLLTDGTNGFKGFNASYTKYYNGTDIKVPDPNIPLPTAPPNPLSPKYLAAFEVVLKMSPRQARAEVADLEADGYKVLWVSPYRVGPNLKPYFDVILTNASEAEVKGYLDLSIEAINTTIYSMKEQGYSASYIVSRDRGKNPDAPFYSAVFTRKNDIFETEVYLRDSIEEYEERLTSMKAKKYRLLSHSFCEIQGKLEVVSVYERDRRLAYNISAPDSPLWQSRHNLTFFRFSEIALTLGADGYYPSYVESFNFGSNADQSMFAAVFEKPNGVNLNWFRWAVETEAARTTIDSELEEDTWQPSISLAYNYLGNVRHYLGFTRRKYEY